MNPMVPIGGDEKKHFDPAEAIGFRQHAFVRKRLFQTEQMRVDVSCIVPGQENPLHRHPLADEVLYVVSGSGESVVGDETYRVRAGDLVLAPKDAPHAVRNTHASEDVVCILAQAPLPCEHVPVKP